METVKNTNQELAETLEAWPKVAKLISTIRTERDYQKTVVLLDKLIDSLNENSEHQIESLIDIIGTLVKEYEDRNTPEPTGTPLGCLQFLMKEHGLKQNDLTEIGSQGVVSEIISGKRGLNLRQIKALSQRFHCSPLVFIDMD